MVTAAGARARKSAPRSLYPRGAELDYAAKLRRRLRLAARGVRKILVEGDEEAIRFDSSASDEDRVRRAIGRVRVLYFEKYTEVTDESLALEVEGRVTGYIERQTARQVKAVLGVDVLPTVGLKHQASEFTRDSVALIRSVGEEFFQDLEADILQAMQGGARWEQLSSVIAERYGLSAKRANLIARDQMGTLVSKISQAKQQAAGATKYIWRTSEDERVVGAPGNKSRPNHRHGDHYARNGKLFSWSNPPHDGHPGEAINCRCTAEPVWDDEAVDAQPADESDLVFDPVAVAKKAAEARAAAKSVAKRVEVHRNKQGELTDGVYRVSVHGTKRHMKGTAPAGKSVFNVDVDAELLTLEAARIADEQGLWDRNRATIDMGVEIGIDAYTNEATRFITLHRKKSGAIHAHPDAPREQP